jgi:tetratricopeptide (TPR) repeat protein
VRLIDIFPDPTPLTLSIEIAQNFKEQGNEYFKGKRYREALGFYKQGIDAKPENEAILEALLCNSAVCNLELSAYLSLVPRWSDSHIVLLENYGSVLRDCSKAISNNGKCSKAYYRSALALLALDRVDEAIDCCNRCLAFDSSNTVIRNLNERALKVKKEKEAREQARRERIKKEQEDRAILAAAYRVCRFCDTKEAKGRIDY